MTYVDQVQSDYFNWLYNIVCSGKSNKFISYTKMFEYMHNKEFTFTIENDINRAKDGTDLRYRYSMLQQDENIFNILNDRPCSILEMMVAIAVRCEETIMYNTSYGDRTSQWFWNMMSNIGISFMTDDRYDELYLESKLETLLKRQYRPDGNGGLFYIRNCKDDLRCVEIWTQLCWYLNNFD